LVLYSRTLKSKSYILNKVKHGTTINLKHLFKFVILGIFFLSSSSLYSQWGTEDDASAKDSTSADTSAKPGDGFGWGGEGTAEQPKIVKKPYVRFIPPYDTLRELIFYEGIIEDEECETCTEDSLYNRARNYLVKRFGKKDFKKFIVEDKKPGTLTLKVKVPMVLKSGKYAKARNGDLEYTISLRFKEARYKYQFGRFAHVQLPQGLNSTTVKTYHEYYMKAKRGFESTDKYLLAADDEVKSIVEGLKRALKEPYKPEEDDW